MLSILSCLIGLLVSYTLAFLLGKVNLGNAGNVATFSLPNPLHFGIGLSLAAIISFCLMAIFSTVEIVGDISEITKGGAQRKGTNKEFTTATYANDLGTSIAGILVRYQIRFFHKISICLTWLLPLTFPYYRMSIGIDTTW
jgi:NCS2 family nucleobase:cation symporter-2